MNKNWKKQIVLFLSRQAVSLFGSSLVQFAIVWYVTKEGRHYPGREEFSIQ
ncbi:MAG: hypothetical protein PHR92_16905 [Lachnospiraceae bacterium]|nr:hypothetical protein [Lachnospiraceae bacterium]